VRRKWDPLVRICWTAGVLPALASVLTDCMTHASLLETFPDRRIRTEYVAARNRAISAIMNLSMPPRNRIAVFHTPELVQALLFVIERDHQGTARQGCYAILAFLAKSVDNRLLMLQVPGLLESVRNVIQPRPPRVEAPLGPPRKKLYPWTEGDGDDDSDSETVIVVQGVMVSRATNLTPKVAAIVVTGASPLRPVNLQ
jgi:hypothetical protein